MNALLDTHSFLWWCTDPNKLSAPALTVLRDPLNTIWLSVISVWEILIKHQIGKLRLPSTMSMLLAQQQANGISILPVSLRHVLAVEHLPLHHKDPFDRILIAQSLTQGYPLLSADVQFRQYPIQVIW